MAREYSKKYPGVYAVKGSKSTTYGIDYVRHTSDGKMHVQKIIKGCTSEKEADKIRSIEMADASRDLLNRKYDIKSSANVIPFKKAVNLYEKWAESNKKSYYVERFKYPILCKAFESKLLSDITPAHIERYKTDRAKEVHKKTVNQELVLLRQIYSKCIEWKEYAGENPTLLVKNFKIPKDKKPGSLTPAEVAAIMRQIVHPVERDMVIFAYNSGWRISEIRKLKWDDVNLKEGVAWIMDGKNSDNARIVLNKQALDVIKHQPHKGDYVFCKHNGEPYKTCLNSVIKSAAERAEVPLPPRKKWHLFRRTWATMMHQLGYDIATIQEQGNWKDPSMPLWYGDSMRDKDKRRRVNRIPKLKA